MAKTLTIQSPIKVIGTTEIPDRSNLNNGEFAIKNFKGNALIFFKEGDELVPASPLVLYDKNYSWTDPKEDSGDLDADDLFGFSGARSLDNLLQIISKLCESSANSCIDIPCVLAITNADNILTFLRPQCSFVTYKDSDNSIKWNLLYYGNDFIKSINGDNTIYCYQVTLTFRIGHGTFTATSTKTAVKDIAGLSNVDNTSDANKPISTAQQAALDKKVDKVSGKSLISDTLIQKLETGVATLGEDGKVLTSQLPSYVDDVVDLQTITDDPTFAEVTSPQSGQKAGLIGSSGEQEDGIYTYNGEAWERTSDYEADKIYICIKAGNNSGAGQTYPANSTWRWSGTTLVQISTSIVIGTTTGTAYDGGKGKALEEKVANIPDGEDIVTEVEFVTETI